MQCPKQLISGRASGFDSDLPMLLRCGFSRPGPPEIFQQCAWSSAGAASMTIRSCHIYRFPQNLNMYLYTSTGGTVVALQYDKDYDGWIVPKIKTPTRIKIRACFMSFTRIISLTIVPWRIKLNPLLPPFRGPGGLRDVRLDALSL